MIDWIAKHAPLIGLLFFFTVFMVMLVMTYRPSNKKRMQEHADIPLKD